VDHYYGGINPDYSPVIRVLSNDPDFLPELRFPHLPSSYIPQLPLVNPAMAEIRKQAGQHRDIDFQVEAVEEESGFLVPPDLLGVLSGIMRENSIMIQNQVEQELLFGSGYASIEQRRIPPLPVRTRFRHFLWDNRESFARWLYKVVSGFEFPYDY
jgi:hypothetical protein